MLRKKIAKLLLDVVALTGQAAHSVSLGVYIGLTERGGFQTFLESGPSLFCACCGERWHVLSDRGCPNGCAWIYSTFRAPVWAADREILRLVHRKHFDASEKEEREHAARQRWPTVQ